MDEKKYKTEEDKRLQSYQNEILTKETQKGLFTFYRQQQEYEQIHKKKQLKLKSKSKIKKGQSFGLVRICQNVLQQQKYKPCKFNSTKTIMPNSNYQNYHTIQNHNDTYKKVNNSIQPNKQTINSQQCEKEIEIADDGEDEIHETWQNLSNKYLNKIKQRKVTKSSLIRPLAVKSSSQKKIQFEGKVNREQADIINKKIKQKLGIKKCYKQFHMGQILIRKNIRYKDSILHIDEVKKWKQKKLCSEISKVLGNKNGFFVKQKRNTFVLRGYSSPKKIKVANTAAERKTVTMGEQSPPPMNKVQGKQENHEDMCQNQSSREGTLLKGEDGVKFPSISNQKKKIRLKKQNEKYYQCQLVGSMPRKRDKVSVTPIQKSFLPQSSILKNPRSQQIKYTSLQQNSQYLQLETQSNTKNNMYVAVVDMSRSDINQGDQKNISWGVRKKLLMKNFGVKL